MAENLRKLVSERGYIKAKITRIATFCGSPDVKTASFELLFERRGRLIDIFKEYDEYNKKIVFLDPNDDEDTDKYEDAYSLAMACLNKEIKARKEDQSLTEPKKSGNNNDCKGLPQIDIKKFDGKNVVEYAPFINMFKAVIHSNVSLGLCQKLYYLRTFLAGEALDLIKNLPLADENYASALSLLEKRYNNVHMIVNHHINTLMDLPAFNKCTAQNLRSLITNVNLHTVALKNLNLPVEQWDALLVNILARKIDTYTNRGFHLERDEKELPSLTEFINFLEKRALAMESTSSEKAPSIAAVSPSVSKPGKPGKSASNVAAASSCKYCKKSHKLYECALFKLASDKDRAQFVKENMLCVLCLNSHRGKCRLRVQCSVCQKQHNTLMHMADINIGNGDDVPKTNPVNPEAAVVMSSTSQAREVLLPTAIVRLIDKKGKFIHARALLDTGSQVSFVSEKLAGQIDCTISPAAQVITGIIQSTNTVHQKADFAIYSSINDFKIDVTCFLTMNITCELPQQSFDIKGFNMPSHVKLADKNFNKTGEILLLLGCGIFFQVLQRESLPLAPSGPFLVSTSFGHVVAGSLPVSSGKVVSSNLCVTVQGNIFNKINDRNPLKDHLEDFNDTLSNFWKCEQVPNIYKEGSTEHQLAEECFQNSVKLVDKKFFVALPLKLELDDIQLGDSFSRALKRFYNLEKRLSKDDSLHQQYSNFMHTYIQQGHAKYFDISNYDPKAENVYYLPHHPVINPNSKTTPVRAVFNASMTTNKNICLHDVMLNGPVVQNDLFDILILFRNFKFVLLCDIKAMYRGIMLDNRYCCLQNILWRNSPHDPVQCLQLQTVTYGLKSSAFLATRCLTELAERYKEQYPLASFALKFLSYVDDIQCLSNELSELFEAKRQIIELLGLASFSLHKWCSNSSDILNDIPIELHQLSNKDFDKAKTYIKTLGLTYDVVSDTLNMKCPVTQGQESYTKRQMLSFICKFFDPLGLVGPILVQAKHLMQQVWFENVGWDDVLPDFLNKKFVSFTKSLMRMECISVPRNINVPSHKKMELVGYADASNIAHGCCLYLRVIGADDKVDVNILCSKSRINPKDQTLTVPRLELNSALLLAMLARKVHDTLSLKYSDIDTYLYLDSKIALSWLQIEPIKLTVYVANRVHKIKELSDNFQWNYVNTGNNPADCLSRGLEPEQLMGNSLWFHGPQYLQSSDYVHCKSQLNVNETEIPDMKKPTAACNVCHEVNDFNSFLERYSNLERMTRIMAYVRRFVYNCKKKYVIKRQGHLTSDEMSCALHELIKIDQGDHFQKELKELRSGVNLNSGLSSLNPFVDGNGLLRVGGRLQNTDLAYQQRHPIILPKGSTLVKLIIYEEHLRLKHAGQKLTLSSLGERYWLINANREVKSVLHKCVVCFRLKAKSSSQLMGSLPLDRVNITRPFQVVGTDYAGPFNVKQTRVRKPVITKAYVVIFICFSTKAIHIELVSDMTTNAFFACLKRFISRRNKPTKIYCDNASYYKGANNVLKELHDVLNSTEHQSKVLDYGSAERISFHFIPSYSPVFGGLWEAGIKSVKYHMKRVIGKMILTFEELYTVLVQIEGILNSRPLTPMSRDSSDMTYLTPAHFLTGAPLTSYPELNLMDANVGRLSFWRQCTQMQQHFWRQWHKQYLVMLQSRPKWRDQQPNLEKGVMVLLKSDNVAPLNWPVGRIVEVIPGKDNLVRALDVKTAKGFIIRTSVMKVCPLPIDYS